MTVLDPRKDHPGTKAQAVGNVPDLGKCTESQLRAIVDEQAALLRSNASTEAVDILVASEEIAEARAWPAVAATARYLRARVVLEDGRVDEALGLIDAAAIGFREAGESLSAVRTGLGAMHALDDLGRHAEAAAAGESMLAGLAALGPGPDTDWLEAATLGNLGVAYGFTGRHEDALAAQETSAAIWDRLDLPHERALAEANQAIELHSLGRARQARLLFDRALRGFEAADDRLWIAKCHTHRAEALLQLGEFHPALEDVEAAREALRELGATTEQSRLTIIAARARAGLDQPQLAIETLALAIDDPETLPRERATAELLLGLAERQTGRTGVDALRSAHQRFSDLGDDSSRLTAAIALADARGDIESLRSAHHEARSLGRPVHIVSSAVALADHGDSSGLAAAAPVAIDLQLPVLVAAVAMREGERALDEGAFALAVERFDLAWSHALELRSRLGHETLRLAFQGGRRRTLDGLVDALVRRNAAGDVDRARRLVDEDRSRTLVERLGGVLDESATTAAGDDDRLRSDLGAAYSALFASGLSRSRADAIAADIASIESSLTESSIRSAAARTASRRRHRGQGREGPPPGYAALVFHVLADRILAFVVDGSATSVHTVDAPPVRAAVRRFEAAVRTRNRTRPQQSLPGAGVGRELVELEVALVGPVLEAVPETGPIVVVADNGLHHVPFHAFGALSAGGDRPVSVVPSLASLSIDPPTAPDGGRVVLVGVPDDSIPHVSTEIQTLSERWCDPTVLLDTEATRDAVRSAMEGSRVVHLACHGLHRPGDPSRSAIRLSDGWLDATDLRSVDLRGALVILSACDTGQVSGPEPHGLARAFLAAGAVGCITSAWPVGDAVTASFMAELHHTLASDGTAVDALASARNAVAATDPHPADWAAFSLVGDPRS